MALITVAPADVSRLSQAITRTGTAGGAGNLGDAVQINGSGLWVAASAAAAGTATARGVVVGVLRGGLGYSAFVTGDAVDVALWGPVTGYAGMTPGTAVFLSDTAGRLDTAAGTVSKVLGYAESATTVVIGGGI